MKVNQLLTEGKRALPKGYKIVDGPKKPYRFVQTPDGKIVPNQGTRPQGDPEAAKKETDQQIIDDFYIWYDKQNPPKVHKVPKGTMPKGELNKLGQAAKTQKDIEDEGDAYYQHKDKKKNPFDAPPLSELYGHCNYDPRIKRREKGERPDPNYLGELTHFAHDNGNDELVMHVDGKNDPVIGKIKSVGYTYKQNPMTELWHKAETLEIHLALGGIVPATRLGKKYVIVQDYRFKAFMPKGWEKLRKAMQAVTASPRSMDEILRDLDIKD